MSSLNADSEKEEDLQLIKEEVKETGLPLTDETINIAKGLLPDGDQVSQSLEQLDTTLKLELMLN